MYSRLHDITAWHITVLNLSHIPPTVVPLHLIFQPVYKGFFYFCHSASPIVTGLSSYKWIR